MFVLYEGFFIQEDLPHKLARDVADKHITINFKPKQAHSLLYGTKAMFKIIGYGNDGVNEGYLVKMLSVETDNQEDGKMLWELYNEWDVPHITLSLSNEGQAKKTKFLEFTPVEGDIIEGIFGGYDTHPIF